MERMTALARIAKRLKDLSTQIRRNRKRIQDLENEKRINATKLRALQRQVKRVQDLKEFQRKMRK